MKGRVKVPSPNPLLLASESTLNLRAACAPLVLGQHALDRSWHRWPPAILGREHCPLGCGWERARVLVQGQVAELSRPTAVGRGLQSHLTQWFPNTRHLTATLEPPRGFPRISPWSFWPKRAGVEPGNLQLGPSCWRFKCTHRQAREQCPALAQGVRLTAMTVNACPSWPGWGLGGLKGTSKPAELQRPSVYVNAHGVPLCFCVYFGEARTLMSWALSLGSAHCWALPSQQRV